MKKKAIVLLSGGIDSSTTLVIAESEGYELYALSFDYNQKHKNELEAAKKVATATRVKRHLIIKFDMRDIGGSALLDEREIGKRGETEKDKFTHSPIPATYVPARNTIFLSFALAWAEVLNAADIFIGANAIDYSGYPDCRPEYLKAFEGMANLATKASVEGKMRFKINAPLINMSKAEIIKMGINLGLDYSMTWSCYDPQSPEEPKKIRSYEDVGRGLSSQLLNFSTSQLYVPCGRCDSCLFRAKGFKEAGIKDPLLK